MATSTSSADRLVMVSTPSDGVRVIAFNRPAKRNAFSQQLIDDFLGVLSEASTDEAVRVIVVTGNGGVFSAGADIKEISQLNGEDARQCRYLEDLCTGMRKVRKPLIAAVEGIALGGGFEVALMCDLIFASTTSRFGLPEVTIGLIPGAGGTQRLTNAVGKFKAMELILLGTPISAADAKAAGLVAQICETGAVLDNAVSTASAMAAMSPAALSLAKEAVCRSDDLGRDDDFERSLYYFAFGTRDKKEGVEAFLQKRSPNWAFKSRE